MSDAIGDEFASPRVTIDVHLGPESMAGALRSDVERGLTSAPKELPPKWFYDERGSRLFEEITRLPEYYPTRCEREILIANAAEIAARTRADTLVELGSGNSEKTRILLDAMSREGSLKRFVPLDVSEATLRDAAEAIASEYPAIAVNAIVGDFEHHMPRIPGGGRRVVAFLGGTIGNFRPSERRDFAKQIVDELTADDHFLLGTDLVKDVRRLEAAYDDSAGVTAAFNLNVLSVINRELGADFELDSFEHVAKFDRESEWIEMRLRSKRDQVVAIDDLGIEVAFAEGEEMRTEISAKFRRGRLESEMGKAGLEAAGWWTDAAGDFAVSLWKPLF